MVLLLGVAERAMCGHQSSLTDFVREVYLDLYLFKRGHFDCFELMLVSLFSLSALELFIDLKLEEDFCYGALDRVRSTEHEG